MGDETQSLGSNRCLGQLTLGIRQHADLALGLTRKFAKDVRQSK